MKYALLFALLFWIVAFALVVYACSTSAATVGQDAYSYPAFWRSYADYVEGRLYIPGLDYPACSSGVTYLGDHVYRVPAGVESFHCDEGRVGNDIPSA